MFTIPALVLTASALVVLTLAPSRHSGHGEPQVTLKLTPPPTGSVAIPRAVEPAPSVAPQPRQPVGEIAPAAAGEPTGSPAPQIATRDQGPLAPAPPEIARGVAQERVVVPIATAQPTAVAPEDRMVGLGSGLVGQTSAGMHKDAAADAQVPHPAPVAPGMDPSGAARPDAVAPALLEAVGGGPVAPAVPDAGAQGPAAEVVPPPVRAQKAKVKAKAAIAPEPPKKAAKSAARKVQPKPAAAKKADVSGNRSSERR
jgi:hypothetical protein